jgi:hypothetical protein
VRLAFQVVIAFVRIVVNCSVFGCGLFLRVVSLRILVFHISHSFLKAFRFFSFCCKAFHFCRNCCNEVFRLFRCCGRVFHSFCIVYLVCHYPIGVFGRVFTQWVVVTWRCIWVYRFCQELFSQCISFSLATPLF